MVDVCTYARQMHCFYDKYENIRYFSYLFSPDYSAQGDIFIGLDFIKTILYKIYPDYSLCLKSVFLESLSVGAQYVPIAVHPNPQEKT